MLMQYLSIGILRKKTDPKYEKAIDALAEKYAESQIDVPSPSAELLTREARKKKLKYEFRKQVELEEYEKHLVDAVAVLLNDGPRHLKQEEWEHLLRELRKAKKKLRKIDYKENLAEPLYPSLGITASGMRSIDTIARLKYRFKEYKNAISLHVLLATLNGGEPLFWYHLAICFQEAKIFEKATTAYSFCHILDPDNIAAYVFSAECFLELNNKKEAKPVYEEAVKLVAQQNKKSYWNRHLKYIQECLEKS